MHWEMQVTWRRATTKDMCAGSLGRWASFAVHLSELVGVLWPPPAEENKVVDEVGVLVYAHEGEESVEDLVVDLYPVVSQGLRRECLVQQS